LEKFLQFARVILGKSPKPPTPLKFSVHTKKFQNPTIKKYLDTPLRRVKNGFGSLDEWVLVIV
jgi:hypothetical protein